jgi:uncharacterized protein YjhX (UPF0386 family)
MMSSPEDSDVDSFYECLNGDPFASPMKVAEKMRVVGEVSIGDATQYSVAMRNNIKYTTVKQWVFKVKRHITLHEKGGRPRNIDQEGLEQLRRLVVERGEEDVGDLSVHINQAYRETLQRRCTQSLEGNSSAEPASAALHKRTLRRYVIMLTGR